MVIPMMNVINQLSNIRILEKENSMDVLVNKVNKMTDSRVKRVK